MEVPFSNSVLLFMSHQATLSDPHGNGAFVLEQHHDLPGAASVSDLVGGDEETTVDVQGSRSGDHDAHGDRDADGDNKADGDRDADKDRDADGDPSTGFKKDARKRYQQIVEKYPDTPTAKRVKKLLEKP
jgi:hypothetical protein